MDARVMTMELKRVRIHAFWPWSFSLDGKRWRKRWNRAT
jgi:hypothetical protein